MSISSDVITLIEATLSFLIPALIMAFCAIIVIEERREAVSLKRIKRCLKLMLLPLGFMIVSAVEETIYFTAYDHQFSMEYTWTALVTSYIMFYLYALTVFKTVKSSIWLVVACETLLLIEVLKLLLPQLSFAYVVDANIHISAFASAIFFYASFLFLAFSISRHQRK
jgi:hypothetical protein